MYFGGFFFLCVDLSVVFNHSNTSIEIILSIYRNILQAYNQEDLNLEVYMLLYLRCYYVCLYNFLSLSLSSYELKTVLREIDLGLNNRPLTFTYEIGEEVKKSRHTLKIM